MAKVYLYNMHDNEYLCINIDRQTSTGRHRDLEYVKDLSETTDRPISRYFKPIVNMSADEVKEYVSKHMRDSRILDEIDDTYTYEYW